MKTKSQKHSKLKQALGSSIPNNTSLPAPFGLAKAGLNICSWNADGLFHHDLAHRKNKFAHLRKISLNRHILCLQEIHGKSEADILSMLGTALPGWEILASAFEEPDSNHSFGIKGGVAICICPELQGFCSIDFSVLAPGRCIAAFLSAGTQSIKVTNIHNFGLSLGQANRIRAHFEACRACAREDPANNFAITIGDINFMAPGERRFKAGVSVHDSVDAHRTPSSLHQRILQGELANWTELAQPFPTRFDAASSTSSRIDRGWVTSGSSR